MIDETKGFLNAGLLHYPEAVVAVTEFRRHLTSLIERVARENPSGDWQVPPDSEFRGTRSEANGVWVGAGGPLRIRGEDVTLEVGIWWDCPALRGISVVFAAYFSAGSTRVRRELAIDEGAGDLKLMRIGSEKYVWLEPRHGESDVESELRRLVDGCRRAISAGP